MIVWKKLGELCTKITDGSHNPPKGILEGKLMLSSRNIQNNSLVLDEVRYISEEDFVQENKRTDVNIGDVLLTIVGTIGRTLVVDSTHPKFVLQRSVAVLKPNASLINPYYLSYVLASDVMQDKLQRLARGVAQKGVYLRSINELKVPVVPMEVQLKIADTVACANKIKLSNELYNKKLDLIVDSIISKVLQNEDSQ